MTLIVWRIILADLCGEEQNILSSVMLQRNLSLSSSTVQTFHNSCSIPFHVVQEATCQCRAFRQRRKLVQAERSFERCLSGRWYTQITTPIPGRLQDTGADPQREMSKSRMGATDRRFGRAQQCILRFEADVICGRVESKRWNRSCHLHWVRRASKASQQKCLRPRHGSIDPSSGSRARECARGETQCCYLCSLPCE